MPTQTNKRCAHLPSAKPDLTAQTDEDRSAAASAGSVGRPAQPPRGPSLPPDASRALRCTQVFRHLGVRRPSAARLPTGATPSAGRRRRHFRQALGSCRAAAEGVGPGGRRCGPVSSFRRCTQSRRRPIVHWPASLRCCSSRAVPTRRQRRVGGDARDTVRRADSDARRSSRERTGDVRGAARWLLSAWLRS